MEQERGFKRKEGRRRQEVEFCEIAVSGCKTISDLKWL